MIRCIVLLVLMLALATPARAAEDYCPLGGGTAVLLVDRTTAFDATDKSLFLQALDGVVANLGPGDRLVLFTMTGAYTESRKLFDRCKPGCPDEGFFAGLLATCRPVVARADTVAYTRELAQTLAGLLVAPEETRFSDLFRTVAEAVRSYATAPQKLRTVIIFSDLIENSALLPERDLKRLSPAESLQRLRANGISPQFAGAEIRVFGFGRDDTPGRPPLPQALRQRIADTWRHWFAACGASKIEIGLR